MTPLGHSSSENDSRRLRILCADDDPVMGSVLLRILAANGYEPELATDGEIAARRVLQDHDRFDLLVTDNEMPGGDGIALVQTVRRAGYLAPIIVHCSPPEPQDEELYRRHGANALIEKPASSEHILSAIAEVWNRWESLKHSAFAPNQTPVGDHALGWVSLKPTCTPP